MRTTNKFIFAAAMALAAPVCAKEVENAAARVNNAEITMSEFTQKAQQIAQQYAAAMPSFFKQTDASSKINKMALDNLVSEKLMYQKAEESKVKIYEREFQNGIENIRKNFELDEDGNKRSQKQIEDAFREELAKENLTMDQFQEKLKKQMMVQKLMQDVIKKQIKAPTETEIKDYFAKLTDIIGGKNVSGLSEEATGNLQTIAAELKKATDERIRLRHILIKVTAGSSEADAAKAKKKAETVKKELDNGLDFDEAVQKYSDDPDSKSRLGDLGYITRGMLLPEIENPAFAAEVGVNTAPVKSKFGWHILRVEEKRAKQKIRYENVKSELEKVLAQIKSNEIVEKYVNELKAKAKIQIYVDENTGKLKNK